MVKRGDSPFGEPLGLRLPFQDAEDVFPTEGVNRAVRALETAHDLTGDLMRLLLPVAGNQHFDPSVRTGNVERPLAVFPLVPVGNRTHGRLGGVGWEVHRLHACDYA